MTDIPMVYTYATRYGVVQISERLYKIMGFGGTFAEYVTSTVEQLAKSLREQHCTLREVRYP